MNIIHLILGNICSLLGTVLESASTTRKTAKSMIFFQSLSQLVYCIGTVFLGGYSAAVQNGVNILRNYVVLKGVDSKAVERALIALGVVLGILLNNLGWIGYLPIAANVYYTLAIFRFQDDEYSLKKAFFVSLIGFTMFNVAIFNVVGALCNLMILITTGIVLFKSGKKA